LRSARRSLHRRAARYLAQAALFYGRIMVNEQLVTLTRAIVTAVRGTEFDAEQLRKLFLRVVPELLAEIEILGNVTASALLPSPPDDSNEKKTESRSARRRRKRRGGRR
jgi:hypothetical protein